MTSKSSADFRRKLVLHAALVPLALVWLFPLWMMFIFSTMAENGIFSPDIVLDAVEPLPRKPCRSGT